MNLYEYVTSNPANYVDPWGLVSRAELLESVDKTSSMYAEVLREVASLGTMAQNDTTDSQLYAKVEQVTRAYNDFRRVRNETMALTGEFFGGQWWISRKDRQAIDAAYRLVFDDELGSHLSADLGVLYEEMEICCSNCAGAEALAGRTQAMYTAARTTEMVCTVTSAAGGVAVIGKEAAKLGVKKGAAYVAKQAAMIAATQAGMTFVVHPLAEKYGISETKLRVGLAALQALTMYKSFRGPGAEPRCVRSGSRGGENLAAKHGRQVHAAFKQRVTRKPGWQTEPRLLDPKTGKIVKPDALTPSGRPVELKPRTPTGIRSGQLQLRKYERAAGKRGRVIYYDPEY